MFAALTFRAPAAMFLIALLAAGPAGGAPANDALPEIEYASPIPSVWTTRLAANGEPANPLLHVADAILAKAGIAWHGRSYPTARMFRYLQDGNAQFSILVKSPALKNCCLLSRQPITALEIRSYHLADKTPITRPQQLSGKRIITIHGYSYGDLHAIISDGSNHISNNIAPDHAAAFRMLAERRADYVIDYVGPATEILAATPLPGLQSELLSRQDAYLVLSKRYPDAARIMARLENIAQTLDIDRIMQSK